jgi:hypothetical protein
MYAGPARTVRGVSNGVLGGQTVKAARKVRGYNLEVLCGGLNEVYDRYLIMVSDVLDQSGFHIHLVSYAVLCQC